jgi:hypothetical protein
MWMPPVYDLVISTSQLSSCMLTEGLVVSVIIWLIRGLNQRLWKVHRLISKTMKYD